MIFFYRKWNHTHHYKHSKISWAIYYKILWSFAEYFFLRKTNWMFIVKLTQFNEILLRRNMIENCYHLFMALQLHTQISNSPKLSLRTDCYKKMNKLDKNIISFLMNQLKGTKCLLRVLSCNTGNSRYSLRSLFITTLNWFSMFSMCFFFNHFWKKFPSYMNQKKNYFIFRICSLKAFLFISLQWNLNGPLQFIITINSVQQSKETLCNLLKCDFRILLLKEWHH